jgi:hypothetical protein
MRPTPHHDRERAVAAAIRPEGQVSVGDYLARQARPNQESPP